MTHPLTCWNIDLVSSNTASLKVKKAVSNICYSSKFQDTTALAQQQQTQETSLRRHLSRVTSGLTELLMVLQLTQNVPLVLPESIVILQVCFYFCTSNTKSSSAEHNNSISLLDQRISILIKHESCLSVCLSTFSKANKSSSVIKFQL